MRGGLNDRKVEPTERVEAIEVLWPDGTAEAFPGQPVDQMVVLRKGEGKPMTR